MKVRGREGGLWIRTPDILFSQRANQQIAVFSDFFAKGEGTEAITFMLAFDKCLELLFQNFFTKSLHPLSRFPGIFPLTYLVGDSACFYCSFRFFQISTAGRFPVHTAQMRVVRRTLGSWTV